MSSERSTDVPDHTPLVALAPDPDAGRLAAAIREGGAELVPLERCEAIVWSDPRDPSALVGALERAPGVRWVQLPFAGIENFVDLLDPAIVWTCGKGVYADPVAEMALALGLAGLRGLGQYVRATAWSGPIGRNLLDANVAIIGGGAITESLVGLLAPWKCTVTVVRRSTSAMPGVHRVLRPEHLTEALRNADLVVLALALTPETIGIIGREELSAMQSHAWLVNVARGRHIVTDDLVDALRAHSIGGAGLDVTDPEPLPDDHPLWSLPNCIITPHVGNTPEMAVPLLAARVAENVRRFSVGEELIGLVDIKLGY